MNIRRGKFVIKKVDDNNWTKYPVFRFHVNMCFKENIFSIQAITYMLPWKMK